MVRVRIVLFCMDSQQMPWPRTITWWKTQREIEEDHPSLKIVHTHTPHVLWDITNVINVFNGFLFGMPSGFQRSKRPPQNVTQVWNLHVSGKHHYDSFDFLIALIYFKIFSLRLFFKDSYFFWKLSLCYRKNRSYKNTGCYNLWCLDKANIHLWKAVCPTSQLTQLFVLYRVHDLQEIMCGQCPFLNFPNIEK